MERYNLAVIGAGSGGLVVAAGGAALGARVALFERQAIRYEKGGRGVAAMGGDCLHFGCVPSKALLRAAKAARALAEAPRFGVRGEGSSEPQDLAGALEYVRRAQAKIAPHDSVERFTALGVDVLLGSVRLAGPHEVESDGTRVRARHVVLATGSRARIPEVPGLTEAGFLTNETVFSLARLPARLLVIGGGPVGVELGQAFARLGSRVTVVSSSPHVCPREDADAAEVLAARLRTEGVTLLDGARAERACARGAEKVVAVRNGRGEAAEIVADEILVAAGRRPSTEGLNLEGVGVAVDAHGVVADARCRTSVRSIWAIGDVAGRAHFTHWAGHQAGVVLRNTLSPVAFARCDAANLPWVTYTDPEIARVGWNETDAKREGLFHRVFKVPFARNDRAVCDGTHEEGFAKVLVDRKGKIMGATIVHPHAGDLVGEVVLAKKHGLPLSALGSVIRPYPTLSEIHGALAREEMKTALTPRRRRLLAALAAFLRR